MIGISRTGEGSINAYTLLFHCALHAWFVSFRIIETCCCVALQDLGCAQNTNRFSRNAEG